MISRKRFCEDEILEENDDGGEVMYALPSAKRSYNVYDDVMMVKKPTIITINDISATSLDLFRSQCLNMDDDQQIIPIFINSPGGDAYSAFGILDIIKNLKKRGKIIMTICNGTAMSAATLLLASGTKGYRYATENSSIMIHDVSTVLYGKYEELKSNMKELERVNNVYFNLLDEFASQELGFFKSVCQKANSADLYLTIDESINYGIIDKEGYPNLRTRTNINFLMD